MKITSKQVFAAVTGVGLVAILLFYVFFFLEYQEKTEKMDSEVKSLETRLADLRVHAAKAEEYQKEMDVMNVGIEQMMMKYPADAREEDAIMLAVQMEEKENILVNTINIGGGEELASVAMGTVLGAGRESADNYRFVNRKITYSNHVDYLSLKNCIEQIYVNPNKVAINSISYTKAEDGMLQGNIDVSFYSLQGTGKEYVKPDIASYVAGKVNLFQ